MKERPLYDAGGRWDNRPTHGTARHGVRLPGKAAVPILVQLDLRFYLDPTTGQPHIWNHDVKEEEVEEVLARPGEDRPGREGSRVAIGQTTAGRYLRIIYVRDPGADSAFIITAYELGGKPLLAFRKRQRRRHR